MKRTMIFRQQYFDTQRLDGKTTISFFNESDEDDTSVTAMSEDQAVKWLFRNQSFREMFLADFFQNPRVVKSYYGLTEPFTAKNKKPGDIDLLLVHPERPDRALAFECKRVKVTSIDLNVSKINNAGKIRHGVIQANKYQSLGFYQSYLMIILLDDGRKYDTPNTMFRQAKSEDISYIFDIPMNEPLNKDVGVVFIRVSQTTGKHINLGGGLGFCIDKAARPLEQTPQMTNKIRELLKS